MESAARAIDRAIERSSGEAIEPSSVELSGDRAIERSSDRVTDRASDRVTERSNDRPIIDRGIERSNTRFITTLICSLSASKPQLGKQPKTARFISRGQFWPKAENTNKSRPHNFTSSHKTWSKHEGVWLVRCSWRSLTFPCGDLVIP